MTGVHGRVGGGLDRFGRVLARWLHRETSQYHGAVQTDYRLLCEHLRPADVLLVEGNQRVSGAIRYLTQSTWSHAALYIGHVPSADDSGETSPAPQLVEVNMHQGCVVSPLANYARFNTRICRPVGLSATERDAVVQFMLDHVGVRYDMRNIFDLLRYFLPVPPLPVHLRRRALAFGSGDPTRAICSSLIAEAFQSIRYPILPEIVEDSDDACRDEILHIRDHALFVPRDFDLSPFFKVIKPEIAADSGFDFHALTWEG